MRRIIPAIVLAGFALAGCTATAAERIEEDEPDWDCQTMGNLQCGEPIQPPCAGHEPQCTYDPDVTVPLPS